MKFDGSITSDSPFCDIIRQDRLPTTIERKMIRDYITEKKASLSELNARVPRRNRATGRKLSRQLRAELDHTRRVIRFHLAIISPWRWLPVEMMSEIFAFTLSPRENDEHDEWNDDRASTLLLCKICRRWRQIAVSTPALWSVLNLDLRGIEKRPPEWALEWLQRSQSYPAYLQLFWDNTTRMDVLSCAISAFCAHAHHAASLWLDGLPIDDIELVTDIYPRPIFPASTPRAPLLSMLYADLPAGSNWEWVYLACRAAPLLSDLTVTHFAKDFCPVPNLTRLHFVEPVSMGNVLYILEATPGLEDLCVDIDGPSVPRGPIIRMESLARLEVTSNDLLGLFFEHVEMPRLEDVCIYQLTVWPRSEVASFLTRSSCNLKVLDFHNAEVSQDDVIEFLKHKACVSLKALTVADCIPPADYLLQYLTPDRKTTQKFEQWPNPRLEAIELSNILTHDGCLSEMVASRLPPHFDDRLPLPEGVDHLRSIQFSFVDGVNSPDAHVADWQSLQQLEKLHPTLELIWPEQDPISLAIIPA
ncbi:unnamed protein product [Mycena citricolor]|uniref:F-box domain-containing protein n=1 Tax=Mycena citricolor TaxID=2018698 RepID=A0AAD2I1C2_9AGAR|nr:unnamed protein product [Mycena citricolor]CAK5284372.1 unnamed protein product [Mycena citricolor]